MTTENSIMVIRPYWDMGTWVFDDEAVGLLREPFVSGAPEMIDALITMAGGHPEDVRTGFNLFFSGIKYPDSVVEATRMEEDEFPMGTWYEEATPGMTFWLCPALLKYFSTPPESIFAHVTLD